MVSPQARMPPLRRANPMLTLQTRFRNHAVPKYATSPIRSRLSERADRCQWLVAGHRRHGIRSRGICRAGGSSRACEDVNCDAMPSAQPKRCSWVNVDDPLMLGYHDREWGVPTHDDRRHFEFLVLEGAQAG